MIKRPKTGQQICQSCFYYVFETEIHNTIVHSKLFERGERVAIGASGGKGTTGYNVKRSLTSLTIAIFFRLDCASTCLENIKRTIRLWDRALPFVSR